MGALHVHEFITFDGVIDEPEWSAGYDFDAGMSDTLQSLAGKCTAIIFGRRSYEMFQPAWSVRSAEDDAFAPFMNDTPKYVVSGTLTETSWQNSSVLGGYDAEAIRRLKAEQSGDVFTSASGTLVRAMLADGLVDELHLFVYPLTRGSGPRLFPDGAVPQTMDVISSRTNASGVLNLNLRVRPRT
jgi:dihydrofolate reductase